MPRRGGEPVWARLRGGPVRVSAGGLGGTGEDLGEVCVEPGWQGPELVDRARVWPGTLGGVLPGAGD
jgi:hypothetical protein